MTNTSGLKTVKASQINHAMQAYADAAAKINKIGGAAEGVQAGQTFENLLRAEMQTTVQNLRTGEEVSIQAAAGTADLQTVVQALGRAELSLQKVTAVRDRVIAAYEEIMRMPI